VKRVVLIHDAAIDEYISFLLLAAMPDVELAGSVIVNADCLDGPAMQTGWAIQSYIGREDIPLGLSGVRGVNPFPWEYRSDCVKLGRIPPLAAYAQHTGWPPYPDGDAWLASFFQALEEPVTVVCLCPLSALALLLDAQPDAAEKIERLIWMGGAVNVAGNLDPKTLPPGYANPYAEWNVFWDPQGTQRVLESTHFPITMFPLDVTNDAKVAPELMTQLLVDGKVSRVSDLARQAYALVLDQPFYCLWDVTATVYLARPDLYQAPEALRIAVDTTENKTGAILPDPSGREVDVVLAFNNLPGFYEYVTKTLRTAGGPS
jgi:purine nucleosidase